MLPGILKNHKNIFYIWEMFFSNELQNIISGTGYVTKGAAIQAIANHIGKSKAAGKSTEEKELVKKQEAATIIAYSRYNKFFYEHIVEERFLTAGAEQKVYLSDDNIHVIKINDAIFYATWSDYFTSLLLHNFFFPATAYELIGFHIKNTVLYAVVKQPYVQSSSLTNENAVKELMLSNGFVHTRGSDYFHPAMGIILERPA